MPTIHRVEQGEHISRLAEKYGFARHETIWEDPANAELRALRGRPEVLLPGDVVTIPDRAEKQVTVPTTQRHVFRVRTEALELRLKFRDLGGRPVTAGDCTVSADGTERKLQTDGDGKIRTPIGRSTQTASCVVGQVAFQIDVGALDPIEAISGWQARLINLGFLESPIRKLSEAELKAGKGEAREVRAAIEEFQCDQAIPVTGDMDDLTRSTLLTVHGI